METFFFIAQKNDTLLKIYFRAVLTTLESTNYFETLQSYYNKLKNTLSNGEDVANRHDDIIKLYTYGINRDHIYFKTQFTTIDFLISSDFDNDEIHILFRDSHLFYKKQCYDNLSIESHENYFKYKSILSPTEFVEKLDNGIQKCINNLNYIEENYESYTKKDFETIKEKNQYLKHPSGINLREVSVYPKARERLCIMLFDMDLDITNILINLYNLKYNNLSIDNTVSICESLNEHILEINEIEKVIENYN